MAKENGGVIGVLNTPTSTTASGVWALQDQYEAKRNSNWPLTPFVSPNSLRFNSGSSDYLNRTPASAGNRKTWTWSSWIKRSNISTSMPLFSAGTVNTTTNYGAIYFLSTDELRISDSSNLALDIKTNAKYRDVSAWYHIVIVMDTAQATSSNRVKFYVNGEQVTSLATATYPSQNAEFSFNNNVAHNIARDSLDGTPFFNGYLSETYFIDGQALTPSSFGASNASGVWYPIPYTGSYGTNGFYLKFGNASSLGTDSSPNGNNFTVNNLTSVDQSTDSTLNNFSTMNPLDNYYANSTFTEGNLKTVQGASTYAWNLSTIGVSSGKWYAEVKLTTSGSYAVIGVTDRSPTQSLSDILGSGTYDYSVFQLNGDVYNNAGLNPPNTDQSYAASYASGDIISIALDLDNNRIYWAKNGSWSNGTGSWNQSSPSGYISVTSSANTTKGQYFFASGDYESAATPTFEWNFGSPFYSANNYADGNGYGNFSYAVPSGYYALCTANLNTYG